MYYFVETLSASAIVSSYTAPPKLADAAHSRKLLQTHQAIHRSLIVVNPNIDRLQWFGIGFQHPSSRFDSGRIPLTAFVLRSYFIYL